MLQIMRVVEVVVMNDIHVTMNHDISRAAPLHRISW